MTKKYTIILLMLLLIVLVSIDVLIKQFISHHYFLGEIHFVTFFLNITHIHNTGAAFSFLDQYSGWQNYLFILFAFFVVILSMTFLVNHYHNYFVSFSLATIIAGALGNMIDRICYGYVIDYIQFHFNHYFFSIFNFADILIMLSTILLSINILRTK